MNKINVGYFSLEKTADIHYERLAAITTVFLSFYTLITGSMYSAIFCIVLWYAVLDTCSFNLICLFTLVISKLTSGNWTLARWTKSSGSSKQSVRIFPNCWRARTDLISIGIWLLPKCEMRESTSITL